MAACLEVGTLALFSHHCYQFGGQFYKQKKCCPTGLRCSCCLSKICMVRWIKVVSKILVDDVRWGLSPIPAG